MIITSLRLRNYPDDKKDSFPWTLPLVQNLEEVHFEKQVTFLVGENGSGKSTILEAIAAYSEVPLAGSRRLEDDESLAAANELANYLSIRYKEKSRRGFFMRSEDFIGYARSLKKQIKELEAEAQEVRDTFTGGDIDLALGAILGERDQLIKRYSADMEAMSHGEGFLKFFTSRITGKGLYLIDEPEAALSPQRQLSLLSLIKQKAESTGSQFIIATHSPIFMALPGSEVLQFQDGVITKVDYKDTQHYLITKSVLEQPQLIMKQL